MITQAEKKNFDEMCRAIESGDVALMECTLKEDGKRVAVVCAHFVDEDGMHNMVPFARLFEENPYDILVPPDSDVDCK